MLDLSSQDPVPSWIAPVVGAVFGAGGVKMLSVWLENHRLTRKEYRETLQVLIDRQTERIGELEKCVAGLQVRVGNLRVEVAHLESENDELRRASGLKTRNVQEDPRESDASGGESHA